MSRANALAALARPPIGYWKTFAQPSWRVMGMFADAKTLEDEVLERTLNDIFAQAVERMEQEFDAHVVRALKRAAGEFGMALNLAQLAAAHRAHASAIDALRGKEKAT